MHTVKWQVFFSTLVVMVCVALIYGLMKYMEYRLYNVAAE